VLVPHLLRLRGRVRVRVGVRVGFRVRARVGARARVRVRVGVQMRVPHARVHVIVRGALAATLVVPSKYIAMVTLTLKTVGSVWALYDLPVVVQLLLLP